MSDIKLEFSDAGKKGYPSAYHAIASAEDYILVRVDYSSVTVSAPGSYSSRNITNAAGQPAGIPLDVAVITLAHAQDIAKQAATLAGAELGTVTIRRVTFDDVYCKDGRGAEISRSEAITIFGAPATSIGDSKTKEYIYDVQRNRLQIMDNGQWVYENYDGKVTRDSATICES